MFSFSQTSDLTLVLALFYLSISQTSEDAEKPGRYHMIESVRSAIPSSYTSTTLSPASFHFPGLNELVINGAISAIWTTLGTQSTPIR